MQPSCTYVNAIWVALADVSWHQLGPLPIGRSPDRLLLQQLADLSQRYQHELLHSRLGTKHSIEKPIKCPECPHDHMAAIAMLQTAAQQQLQGRCWMPLGLNLIVFSRMYADDGGASFFKDSKPKADEAATASKKPTTDSR